MDWAFPPKALHLADLVCYHAATFFSSRRLAQGMQSSSVRDDVISLREIAMTHYKCKACLALPAVYALLGVFIIAR